MSVDDNRRGHNLGKSWYNALHSAGTMMTRVVMIVVCAGLLGACSGSGEQGSNSVVPATTAACDSIRINEVFFADDAAAGQPWLELINIGSRAIDLDGFVLVTDQAQWRLPAARVTPGAVHVVRDIVSSNEPTRRFLGSHVSEISLVAADGVTVDRMRVPVVSPGESLSRHPNGTGDFYVYPPADVTLQAANPDIGFIHKFASGAEFQSRDSSTNAILRFQDAYWILGGWSNFGGEDWQSYADVCKSIDALSWARISASPPYSPYYSFVVWDGRMWAIGQSSFSSPDGVSWTPENLQVPTPNRSALLGDRLITIFGSTVIATTDGKSWSTLTQDAPWGAGRVHTSALVFRDRIWVIGGVSGYGSADQVVHNDVWSSPDGIVWDLVTPNAAWTPRTWVSAAVYDDKIFIVNGSSMDYDSENYGNHAEIWFSEDGSKWLQLKSERIWDARHASFIVPDDAQQGLLLIAGYSGGGLPGIHSDAWLVQVKLYFPKAGGPLYKLSTWGKNFDGTGPSPTSFSGDRQVFVLRNRASFKMNEKWAVSGAGSRILVGDGDPSHPVVVRALATHRSPPQPVYLNSNSTLIIQGKSPDIKFQDPGAIVLRP